MILFLDCQTVFAAKKSSTADVIITKIKSNFIDVKRQDETVYLYGNVIVEREDLSVLADRMMVYYYEDAKDEDIEQRSDTSQIIKRIEAKDNVKIFNDEFVATGKTGVYDPTENSFVLENDVVFNNGTSLAHGQKFVYNLTTKKGNLVGQKTIEQNIKTDQQDPESNNSGEDHRVIVIINDGDLKKSKNKKKTINK